jgi:hypothetical protein
LSSREPIQLSEFEHVQLHDDIGSAITVLSVALTFSSLADPRVIMPNRRIATKPLGKMALGGRGHVVPVCFARLVGQLHASVSRAAYHIKHGALDVEGCAKVSCFHGRTAAPRTPSPATK